MPKINDVTTRADRNKDAIFRQSYATERTPEQQLAQLDERLGKGVGATRERARLAAQLGKAAAKRVKDNA